MGRCSIRTGQRCNQRREDCCHRDGRYFRSAALPPRGHVRLDFGGLLRGRIPGFRGAASATQNVSCYDNNPVSGRGLSLECRAEGVLERDLLALHRIDCRVYRISVDEDCVNLRCLNGSGLKCRELVCYLGTPFWNNGREILAAFRSTYL